MSRTDLVRKLQDLSERGWDLDDVIFLLEDEYIAVQDEEIDKVKCAVIEFVERLMTQTTWNGRGCSHLCYIITLLIKEDKTYWKAVEETAERFGWQESDILEEIRNASSEISEMEFDPNRTCFEEINFEEKNRHLDQEFIEEAVEWIKYGMK